MESLTTACLPSSQFSDTKCCSAFSIRKLILFWWGITEGSEGTERKYSSLAHSRKKAWTSLGIQIFHEPSLDKPSCRSLSALSSISPLFFCTGSVSFERPFCSCCSNFAYSSETNLRVSSLRWAQCSHKGP